MLDPKYKIVVEIAERSAAYIPEPSVYATRVLGLVAGTWPKSDDGKKYPLHELPDLIAEYLGRPRLDSNWEFQGLQNFRPGRTFDITDCFGWDNTPQGHTYWARVADIVRVFIVEEMNVSV